jgi:hypothetical protein
MHSASVVCPHCGARRKNVAPVTLVGAEIRALLAGHPPPVGADVPDVDAALQATYAAQERAALLIADAL